MSQHTAGPWFSYLFDGGWEICPDQVLPLPEPGADAIAIVYSEDNARLIAAAPELLEAAKDALYTLARLPAETLAIPGVSKSLRVAIAKATE